MLPKRISHITRTILLHGSPVNKAAQWSLAILVSLIWIYNSERAKPTSKGIFYRDKKAELYTPDEIEKWNEQYRPKTDQ